MKKLFTLVLGALVALSAAAAPQQFAKRSIKKNFDKEAVLNHVRKTAPKAPAQLNGSVINIEANNLVVDAEYFEAFLEYFGYGMLTVEGGNNEYFVYAYLYPEDQNYYTTYSTADESIALAIYDADDNETPLTISAAELKSTDKGDQFVATGTDSIGNTYNINLTFFAPDKANDTVVVDFKEEAEVFFYGESQDYYIYVEDEDYIAQLDIFTDTLGGSFETSDFDLGYTNLYKIANGDTVSVGALFSAKADITFNEGVYNIAAELFAADSILYKLNIKYTKPVAKDTVTLNTTGASIIDAVDDAGMFQVVAAPADSSFILVLTPIADDLEGSFTLVDLSGDYSYIVLAKGYASIVDAEFTSVIENNKLKLEGWVLGSNYVRYEFVIETVSLTQGFENVNAGVKATKVLRDGQLIIIKNGAEFNAQGAILK